MVRVKNQIFAFINEICNFYRFLLNVSSTFIFLVKYELHSMKEQLTEAISNSKELQNVKEQVEQKAAILVNIYKLIKLIKLFS